MQHWILTHSQLEAVRDLPVSLLYGYSVYTTFRLPLLFRWQEAHLDRLQQNAQTMGLAFPWQFKELYQQIAAFPQSGSLRLTVFPQVTTFQDLFQSVSLLPSQLLLSYRELAVSQKNGRRILHSKAFERPLPQIKHGSLAGDFMLRRDASLEGADDVVWINRHGHFSEASTANLFFIRDQALYTPDPDRDGCLPGITRWQVLEAAETLGFSVFNKSLIPLELADMDGAFLTNAVSGIQTVRRIDETSFPWPAPALRVLRQIKLFCRRVDKQLDTYPR